MARMPASDLLVARPHAADVLDRVLKDAPYLGGPSVRGWSKISSYMICDRLYYLEAIKKMRPRKHSDALDIGTLFHACMAAHYFTGGQKTWEPVLLVEPHAPVIAAEVKRLLNAYFSKYAAEEAATWDIRGVEYEVIGSMQGSPVSSRFDLVVRVKKPEEPPAPYGPSPNGVYVVDHKAHRAITRDLVEGYGMDGQFLLMGYLWRQQNLDAVFGKLNGFIINIITKTKDPEAKRLEIVLDQHDVDRFEETLGPIVTEIDQRVKAEGAIDEKNWPMNFAVCKSPRGYGICKFFDYCTSHGKFTELYEIAPWKSPSAK